MNPAIAVSNDFIKSGPELAKPVSAGKKNVFKNTLALLTSSEKKSFWSLSILDITINCIDIFSLAFLLWIVQFYLQPVQSKEWLNFLPAWLAGKNSILFIAIFFFLFIAKNLVAFFIAKAQNNFIASVAVRISQNNLSGYQNAEFDEFVNVDSSDHVRKIAYQPFDFCQYMLGGIQQIITQVSLIFITITAIVLFNVRIFVLLLLILLPPVVAVFYFIKKRLTKDKQHIKSSNQLSFQYLMDALKGYVEANIYDRNDFFLNRFVSNRKKFSFCLFDSIALQTLPSRLIEIFAVMGLFILIAIAKWSGNDSRTMITVGAFMAAAYKIIPGLVKIINVTSQIKAYEFSLSDISNDEKKIEDRDDKEERKIQSVQFSNACFYYDHLPVVKNLSFTIQQGDFVGITGKSGKGKTTIFNLLLGFLPLSHGTILINNLPVNKKELKRFWSSISYVRQQSFFIHDTIVTNITLEEKTYDEKKLRQAIEVSGLTELIESSSEGSYKTITENGKNISGGQQQRIALARALYKNADLILLDEPFNELDEASELCLLNYFQQLANSGKMVVMITHNKKALSFCNKTISLDE